MPNAPRWATVTGDVWAGRWPELDRGLSGVAERLDPAIVAAAPPGPFRALDIGCGAGSTSLALAAARPDASIIACDLSPSLIEVARQRFIGTAATAMLGDAEQIAVREGPFDLLFSRHGVMFFTDPPRAFRTFHAAAKPGASLVFSCFEDWVGNAWASELASAAAGHIVEFPGREAGGFAFADPHHVQSLLESAGWANAERKTVAYRYVAGSGQGAVAQARSLLSSVGPASVILRDLEGPARDRAVERMRSVIERHVARDEVAFPAVASLWTATA